MLEKNYGEKVVGMYLVCLHPNNQNKSYQRLKVSHLKQEIEDLMNLRKKMVEKLWGNYAIWFGFFDNGLWRELMVSLVIFSESISSGQSVLIKI